MTEQEAIRRIKNHNEIHSRKEPFHAIKIAEALEMAVEALENRIPKKPMHSGGSVFYVCPNCYKLIRKNEHSHGKIDIPHCKWCGQALDWR